MDDAKARSAFDFFRSACAEPLELISPAKGWVRYSLQLSLVSKPVFHAIAAGGSANRALAGISHELEPVRHKDQLSIAMQQYGKAVASLRAYIDTVLIGKATLEPVVLCCMLLVLYEVMSGRCDQAIAQFRSGWKLIQSRSHESNLLHFLANAFETLGREAHAFDDENIGSISDPMPLLPSLDLHPGSAFVSLYAAEKTLDALIKTSDQCRQELIALAEERVRCEMATQSIEEATRRCLVHCLSRNVHLSANALVPRRVARLIAQHNAWSEALRPMEQFYGSDPPRRLLLLRIRHFTSRFNTMTCRNTKEAFVDHFEEQFADMLDIAKQYLTHASVAPRKLRPELIEEQLRRSGIGPGQMQQNTMVPVQHLSFETGVLPLLNLITFKSRASAIRLRAANMLIQANWREGLHNSSDIGLVAREMERLEADNARFVDESLPRSGELCSAQVPEKARWADVVVSGQLYPRPHLQLLCARYMHEDDSGRIKIDYRTEDTRSHGFPTFLNTGCATFGPFG